MGGKGGSKKVTVGYKYFWDIMAGLGRGPVNEVVAITADKKMIFAGTEGQIRGNTEIRIDKPNLFGGTDTGGEGGIQGTLLFFFGSAEQVSHSRFRNIMTGILPGFRGMVTTYFSGFISAYSASPKPWSYRVRRSSWGWKGPAWYPERALIRLSNPGAVLPNDSELNDAQRANLRTIHAMNGAHILVEAATNTDWGRGLDISDIDTATYQACADTLFNEGFGLCFRYNRQTNLDQFVQQILDHIGAAQYADLETGKLCLKLIRADYNPAALPLFTWENGILDITEDDTTSADDAVNQVVVTYHDPVTNSDGEAKAQNLGAIANSGTISSSTEYKALPTFELAARVAARDLESVAAGLTRLTLRLNRRASSLTPASCFVVSLPERGIASMVLRVGKLNENEDGSWTVTAIQDVFGMPSTAWSGGDQGNEWQPPDANPKPVTVSTLMELPYAVLAGNLSAADLAALSPTACYVGVMARSPSAVAINYLLQSRVAGGNWITAQSGDWTRSVTLNATAGINDLVFTYNGDLAPVVGDALLIDSEICLVTSVNAGEGRIRVSRGCADTYPAVHHSGAVIWLFADGLETDSTEYLRGDQVNIRLLTQTANGVLPDDSAPVLSIAPGQRQSRPYPPAAIRLNGVSWPLSVGAAPSYKLRWAHRDRLLQADQLIDCNAGDIGPEPGTWYRVEITRGGELLWHGETQSNSMDLPWDSQGGSEAVMTIHSVCNGLSSVLKWSVNLPPGVVIAPEPEPEP